MQEITITKYCSNWCNRLAYLKNIQFYKKKNVHSLTSLFVATFSQLQYMHFKIQLNQMWSQKYVKEGSFMFPYIINTRNLGRRKFCMVCSATGRMDPAASDPLLQNCIIDCKIKHLVNFSSLLLKHFIKLHIKSKQCMVRSIYKKINWKYPMLETYKHTHCWWIYYSHSYKHTIRYW